MPYIKRKSQNISRNTFTNSDLRMIITEVNAKTILSKSKVSDYTINPYIGCEHGCKYCYARFMKRFTRHKEPWGRFVDVKINSANLLQQEIKRKPIGKIWISSVCDPYQPLEEKYEITRSCLKILTRYKWPLTIQTKSPLVLRDLDLLKKFRELDIGLSIATADEAIRKIFETDSPPITERVETLQKLRSAKIKTFAMIAPILPRAEDLVTQLRGKVDYVLIDRLNYHYADRIYREHNLQYAITNQFFHQMKNRLTEALSKGSVPYQVLY